MQNGRGMGQVLKSPLLKGGRFPLSGGNGRRPKGVGGPEGPGDCAPLVKGGPPKAVEGEPRPPPLLVQRTPVGAGLCAGPGRGGDLPVREGQAPPLRCCVGRACNLYSPPPGFAGSPLSEGAFEGRSPEKPPS